MGRSKAAMEKRAKKRGISVAEMWKLEKEAEAKKAKMDATLTTNPTTKKVDGEEKSPKEKDPKPESDSEESFSSSSSSSVVSSSSDSSSSSGEATKNMSIEGSGVGGGEEVKKTQLEPGSWTCIKCGNENFARRTFCNTKTCKSPKPLVGKVGEEEKGANWGKQATEEEIAVNMDLRRRYKDEVGREKMSKDERERGKALVERDERKKLKKKKGSGRGRGRGGGGRVGFTMTWLLLICSLLRHTREPKENP